MASSHAAKALRIPGGALVEGGPADIVTVPVASLPLAVVERPARSRVYKRGRLVAQGGKLLG
jgi:cytosine deaminase